ncbi:MAG: DNA-directed RNA polymerase subunit omega [Epsilonproteobacteria bacterium]|nr:DNA-directed RNA polymerase subunit omega [Campylobacterota bacterium]
MRIEQINAKALEKVGFDRYLLSVAVAKRVEEFEKGAKPLIEVKGNIQPTEIAIMEIAEGLIQVKE